MRERDGKGPAHRGLDGFGFRWWMQGSRGETLPATAGVEAASDWIGGENRGTTVGGGSGTAMRGDDLRRSSSDSVWVVNL